MKTRVITGTEVTVVMLAILCLSGTPIFAISISVLSVMAVFELLKAIGTHKSYLISVPAYIVAGAMPIAVYVISDILRVGSSVFVSVIALTLFVFMLYLFFVSVFKKGKMSFNDVSASFVLVTYATVCFSALAVLNYIDSIGIYCVGMVFIGAWVSDVFAYFTGRLLGKHKLIPEVSPKKTVEGSVGAIVFTTLAFLLYGFLVSKFTSLTANYVVLAVSGPVLSVTGQIGDLIASLIKREKGIKDYGTLLPGHGGIMDRFDSILTVAGATMIIVLLFAPFK